MIGVRIGQRRKWDPFCTVELREVLANKAIMIEEECDSEDNGVQSLVARG